MSESTQHHGFVSPNALQIHYTAHLTLDRQSSPQHQECPIEIRGYSRQPCKPENSLSHPDTQASCLQLLR